MAWERILDLATVRAKLETTYGTDPTVADTDVYFVLEGEFISYEPDVEAKGGIQPRADGLKPTVGLEHANWSARVEMQHIAVSSGSSAPECELWMKVSAFAKSDNGGATDYSGPGYTANGGNNDWIITYTAKDFSPSGSSARIEFTEQEEGDADGILYVIDGARSGWSFQMEAGGDWVFECTGGRGIANRPAPVGSAPSIDAFASANPIEAKAMQVALVELAGDTVFGGGTEASPSMLVAVRSFSAQGNNDPAEDTGISGAGGIARARHTKGPWTGQMVLELTNPDDWDVWDLLADGIVCSFRAVKEDPSSANNLTEVACHFVVMGVSKSSEDGLHVATLDVKAAYPESGGDGGGLAPGESFAFKWITRAA